MRISLLKQLLSILKLKLSRTTFYGGMLPLLQLTFFRECPKLHYKHRALTILLYNSRDLLKLLCKGICYALSLCKVKALLGFKISTPTGRILVPNLASMCITPF